MFDFPSVHYIFFEEVFTSGTSMHIWGKSALCVPTFHRGGPSSSGQCQVLSNFYVCAP